MFALQRILVLTGPAGTAKTATVRVLAAELGCNILEWRNTMDEKFSRSAGDWNGVEYEGLSDKFRSFLQRASRSLAGAGTCDGREDEGFFFRRIIDRIKAESV